MIKPSIIQSPCINELEAGQMVTRVPETLIGPCIFVVDLSNLRMEFEKLKQKNDELEKEFKKYVNRPGPTRDYIAGGGWRL